MKRYKMVVTERAGGGGSYVRAVSDKGRWMTASGALGEDADEYGWVTFRRWNRDVGLLRRRNAALLDQVEALEVEIRELEDHIEDLACHFTGVLR